MAITVYNFSIVDDTANGAVAPRNLDAEIRAHLDIPVELDGITIVGNDLNISFQDALSVSAETALDGVVAAHDGVVTVKAAQPLSASGTPLYMPEWREGNPAEFISPNWASKETWYQQSVRVTNEVLTDSGDGLTFNSANTWWVNLTNGKVSNEHLWSPSHAAVITADDVAMTESPTGTTSGDYQIDYENGTVTFNSSQSGKSIKATYSYAGASDFLIEPAEGSTIRLTAVECQFSADLDLTDSIIFQFEGLVQAYAPQLVNDVDPDYVTSFPTGTRIPLGPPRIYKTMYDYIAEAQRAYPEIPTLGGAGWRGITSPLHIFRWPYQEDATRDLDATKGARIRISLATDTPFVGSYATVTLYAVETNSA